MKRSLNLFYMILLTGCMVGQNHVTLFEEDKKSIRSILETYATGWNAENPQQTIMSLFTVDAVIMPHHGDPQVEGKENIRNHFWPAGLTGFRVNSYDFEIMEIAGNRDLAYSRGRYSISFSFEDNGEMRTLNNGGNYIMIFTKVEGEWKIARYIWNDPVPQG